MNRKITLINLGSAILVMLINLMINLILSPYIVETLGAEANGFLNLANNFVMYASLLTIALNSMSARFIALEYHKGEVKSARRFYSSVIVGNWCIVLIFIIPAVFMIINLEKIINIPMENMKEIKELFTFVFINFFITQMFGHFSIATFVKNKLYLTNIGTLTTALVNAILILILIQFGKVEIYTTTVLALGITVIICSYHFLVKRKIMPDVCFELSNVSWGYIKKLLLSGVWNTINQCGNILMTGLDLLLTNLFIDPIQMGILSVAKIIPNNIITLCTAINTNFCPSMVEVYATKDSKKIKAAVDFSMKVSTIVTTVPLMTFFVFGSQFYFLWVPSLEAESMMWLSILTCIAYVPATGTQALYNVFIVKNKLKYNASLFLANGVINIIVIYYCLTHTTLGIYAVAGVSSITTIIRNIVFILPYIAKLLELKWYRFYTNILTSLVAAVLCLCVGGMVDRLISVNGWYTLIIAGGLTAAISFLMLTLILFRRDIVSIVKNKGEIE